MSKVQEQEQSSKERLIQAALELFYARGYSAVGTKELCERARVNKGTFYHHFKSKTDLAIAALDAYHVGAKQNFEKVAASSIPPLRKLERVFEIQLKAYKSLSQDGCFRGCLMGNLTLETAATEPRIREHIGVLMRECESWFASLIEELKQAGDVPDQLDANAGAKSLMSYLQGALVVAIAEGDMQAWRAVADSSIRLLRSLVD